MASEGMPVKIFHNAWGRLAEENINSPQNTSGYWNRFVLADINNDGYEDIIAGNDDITNICKNDAPPVLCAGTPRLIFEVKKFYK